MMVLYGMARNQARGEMRGCIPFTQPRQFRRAREECWLQKIKTWLNLQKNTEIGGSLNAIGHVLREHSSTNVPPNANPGE